MRKKLILLLTFLALAGCRPTSLMYVTPDGPPEYQLGWQDGCDTGLSMQGNYIYKAVYGFKKRTEMSENDIYKNGWNDGLTYCRYSLAADQADK